MVRSGRGRDESAYIGVTIYAVAERAGVSIATVSRALRDPGVVAEATRARVEAAVAELNFTPSRLGRSLAEGRHAANGIVFPDLTGPYHAEVLLGYEEAAADLGRSVLILGTRGRPDPTAQVLDLAGRVDGLVVMGQTVPDDVVASVVAGGPGNVLLRENIRRAFSSPDIERRLRPLMAMEEFSIPR